MSVAFKVVVENSQINSLDCNYVASRIGIYREIVSLDINNAQMLQIWA